MFEVEDMNEDLCNFGLAFIGKTAEIWKQQSFANEFKLLDGNPLESSAWRSVDIGFLIADAAQEEDVNKLKKAVEAANDIGIAVLIPIVISAEPIDISASLLTINPENYTEESAIYKDIYYAIKSVYDIACLPGLVNLDMCDVQKVCKGKKKLLLATGAAKGENASLTAVNEAIDKLTKQNKNAKSIGKDVLMNVTGCEDNISMYEIQEVSEGLYDWMDNKQATIIWGASIDDSLGDMIRVSILIGE